MPWIARGYVTVPAAFDVSGRGTRKALRLTGLSVALCAAWRAPLNAGRVARPIPMAAPTHVLFDFFGTLVAYSDSRIEQGYQRSHELLVAGGARLGYPDFLARWDATCEEFESRAAHTLDEYSMDAVCAEFLRRVLPGVPDAEVVSLFRATYLDEWNKGVRYIPGVKELVAELSERFVLVLVTNTHHADLVHRHLHAMDVAHRFAGVITSVEHGKRKPSPCIFERALVQSGARRDASIYVGDSFAADYRGARNAGLSCLLIDPDQRHDIPATDRIRDIFGTRARLCRARARSPGARRR